MSGRDGAVEGDQGLRLQLVQPAQVVVGGTDQGRPEARAERCRRAAADLRVEQAAAQVDDLCRQVAGRLAELGGLAFVIEQGVLLPGQGLALGGEAFRLVGLRRADHFQLIVEPLDVGHPQREQGVGLALDLQRALAQLGEEVVAGVGGDALADQVELRVELVEAGVLGQGGRRFQVDGRLRSRPGGPGLAAQAQEQAQAMANWQSNICRLARLIESPFRS